ncbi:MAG TPA: hypothetical protein ENN41_04070 [Sediminispirochaeta sp.]|nr:hypothetical protein [Sediminispirochaeta sp.]
MVGRGFRGSTVALLLGLVLSTTLAADSWTTVELKLYNSFTRLTEDQWQAGGGGTASLRFEQTGNRSVRSQVELSAAVFQGGAAAPNIATVDRAFAKFRHRSFQGIIGKAPFSWGEGLIFNVADEIFGSGVDTNLSRSSFEDYGTWITGGTLYFGPFSFLELLYSPGPLTGTDSPSPALIEESRVGARLVGKPAGVKTELGYLFDGQGDGQSDYLHRPYLSLQGNLGVDWHLSASLELPPPAQAADTIGDAFWEGLLFTGGLYSLLPVGYEDSLSFRLEGRFRPDGAWQESGAAGGYGVYSYGELSWDRSGGQSFFVRALFSPIDLSARLSPGFSWNLFEGFSLLGFLSVQIGEENDEYPWDSGDPTAPGLALMLGSSIIY